MTAYLFTVTARMTGRPRGEAVVCTEARYASIRWLDADRLARRYGLPEQWRAVMDEIAHGVPPGPLAPTSAIVALLGLHTDAVAQYVTARPFAVAPDALAAALDGWLLGIA